MLKYYFFIFLKIYLNHFQNKRTKHTGLKTSEKNKISHQELNVCNLCITIITFFF